MGAPSRLRGVEHQLIKDLKESSISFRRLGTKYGVSGQTISNFCHRKGIRRPKREHTEKCSICQGLIGISKKPHSDFISSQTIKKQFSLGEATFLDHLRILRSKGLVSEKFARLHSRKAERAYEIYFKERIPISQIGRQVGLKNFHSIIRIHKDLGWDVPASLFNYNSKNRGKSTSNRVKRERRG